MGIASAQPIVQPAYHLYTGAVSSQSAHHPYSGAGFSQPDLQPLSLAAQPSLSSSSFRPTQQDEDWGDFQSFPLSQPTGSDNRLVFSQFLTGPPQHDAPSSSTNQGTAALLPQESGGIFGTAGVLQPAAVAPVRYLRLFRYPVPVLFWIL